MTTSEEMDAFMAKYTPEYVEELRTVYDKYHGLNGNRGGFTCFVVDKHEMEKLVEANNFYNGDQAEVKPTESIDASKPIDKGNPQFVEGWMVKTHGYQCW